MSHAGDDPRMYALAFSACQEARMEPLPGIASGPPRAGEAAMRHCSRLDPHRWADRDPGNAAPWLYALERADATGDHAGQREALQQLAAAARLRIDHAQATGSVARLRLSDADLAGQTSLAIQALAFELMPSVTGVVLRCKDKAGGDTVMVATCMRIAGVMMDHSDTMMARNVGGSVHKLATGDATRLDEIHKEAAGLGEQRAALTADTPMVEEHSCVASRKLLAQFALIAQVGEVEALKQEIAAHAAK